jgi:hypothetical protein
MPQVLESIRPDLGLSCLESLVFEADCFRSFLTGLVMSFFLAATLDEDAGCCALAMAAQVKEVAVDWNVLDFQALEDLESAKTNRIVSYTLYTHGSNQRTH